MRWIWIRHGETDMNWEKRYLGHLDVPLNERGKWQAIRLREMAAKLDPELILSSDLLRCRQTAELSFPLAGCQLSASADLRELSFGEWEGKSYAEAQASHPLELAEWYSDPFGKAPPQGETLAQFGARIDRILYALRGRMSPTGTAAIISHGGVIRWFQSKWVGGDPSLFWQADPVEHGKGLVAHWNGSGWTCDHLEAEGFL